MLTIPGSISKPLYRPFLPQLALLNHPLNDSSTFEILTQKPASKSILAREATRGSGILTRSNAIEDVLKSKVLPAATYANYRAMLPDLEELLRTGTMVVLTRHGQSVFNRLHDFFYGSLDSPLVNKGKAQAHTLGKTLKGLPIRKIYASAIERAIHTAEIIGSELEFNPPLQITSELNELSHGILDARPRDMTSAKFDIFLKDMEDSAKRASFGAKYGITPEEADRAIARARMRRKLVQDYCAKVGLSEDEIVNQAVAGIPSIEYRSPIDGESYVDGYIRAGRVKDFIASSEATPGVVVLTAHGTFNKEVLMKFLNVDLKNRDQAQEIDQKNCCINILWKRAGSDKWQLLVLNDSADGGGSDVVSED